MKLPRTTKLDVFLWEGERSRYGVRIAEISITTKTADGICGESWMQSDPPAHQLLFACERYLIETERSEMHRQAWLIEQALQPEANR